MIVILLPIIIQPTLKWGRNNLYDRISDYVKSLMIWNEIADNIPYSIYIFENSGCPNIFNLNPKIKYISERVFIDPIEKSLHLSMVIGRFIEILQLKDDDKVFVMNGRYAPLNPLNELLNIIENNDIVVSNLLPKFGKINTEWHSTTVKILKKFVDECRRSCREMTKNFETVYYETIQYYPIYKYKGIEVLPTFIGGINEPIHII